MRGKYWGRFGRKKYIICLPGSTSGMGIYINIFSNLKLNI